MVLFSQKIWKFPDLIFFLGLLLVLFSNAKMKSTMVQAMKVLREPYQALREPYQALRVSYQALKSQSTLTVSQMVLSGFRMAISGLK